MLRAWAEAEAKVGDVGAMCRHDGCYHTVRALVAALADLE